MQFPFPLQYPLTVSSSFPLPISDTVRNFDVSFDTAPYFPKSNPQDFLLPFLCWVSKFVLDDKHKYVICVLDQSCVFNYQGPLLRSSAPRTSTWTAGQRSTSLAPWPLDLGSLSLSCGAGSRRQVAMILMKSAGKRAILILQKATNFRKEAI